MKKNMFYIILVGLISVLGLSYSIFVSDTKRVTAAEILVGNLTYGINIYEEGNNVPVNGTSVTVEANKTNAYFVTVYSTNPISSKFTLAYNNQNVRVELSSRSSWDSKGEIKDYSSNMHTKTIKVIVTNETNTSQTVTLQAFGGYSYNSVVSINLGNGFYSVINTYNEDLFLNDTYTYQDNLISEIVNYDTNCTPTLNNPCLYVGETKVNYFKFNESDASTYRVIGTYLVNNKTLTKIIGPSTTNEFINSETTLSQEDITSIGGTNSYLGSNYSSQSIYYLKEDVIVYYEGTIDSPYIPLQNQDTGIDLNLMAYNYEGTKPQSSYEDYIEYLGIAYTASLECTNGTEGIIDENGVVTFTSFVIPSTCTVEFQDDDKQNYLVDVIKRQNKVTNTKDAPERTSFSDIYGSSDVTFFQTHEAENGEKVYYYAGQAENNWVIFGKCPTIGGKNCTAGDDLYWRIIRTNEETTGGGIRLLYSGSGLQVDENDIHQIKAVQNAYIGTSDWYSSNNTPNYVGYTRKTNDYTEGETSLADIRGNEIDSNIKTATDDWYLATFYNTDYESLIDTKAVYCNDRSTTADKTGGLTKDTYFGANGRLTGYKPSYACEVNTEGFGHNYFEGNSKYDRYTKEAYKLDENDLDYFTNGWLDYPAGLMTADEVSFAGGFSGNNNPNAWYYLNALNEGTNAERSITGTNWWWTMSPSYFGSSSIAYAWGVYGSSYPGYLSRGNYNVSNSGAVRPAISLKSNTLWVSGNGTATSPYRVIEN